ncbi:MAG: DUF2807 domain-containing protein [Burkholderiales bacterium]|nr:DUF2807 domain-containing protein [Burkholderiales bacterium]
MSHPLPILLGLLCATSVAQAAPVEEQRNVGGFQRIRVEGSIDVRVSPGTVRATLQGEPAAVRQVLTELDGDTLVIRQTEAYPRRGAEVVVQIQAPGLSALDLKGSGDVQLKDFKLPALALRVAGSGDLQAQAITVGRLEIKVAGSGDVRLSGRCEQATVAVAGSGDVAAADLSCREVSVSVAGSGNADVHASEQLTASVAGSGDVRYRGRPAQVQRREAGSGRVSAAD